VISAERQQRNGCFVFFRRIRLVDFICQSYELFGLRI